MNVIGTAGHVDHGKSTIIKNLTSIDPDRLREEKEREMTIDLGFAWLNNTNTNEPVGIIDVPGHEDLVDNMLKGVFAIDLALLVVAATESIKQQTIEHLEILKLLNIEIDTANKINTSFSTINPVAKIMGVVNNIING